MRFAPTATGVLQELAVEVRSKTVQLLAHTPVPALTCTPAGTANSPIWHAGHALWLQDVLCIALVTGRSELPAGWAAQFGMGSRPRGPWPPKEDIVQRLQVQLARLVEAIGQLGAEELDARSRFAYPGDERSLQECIVHGLHDEANHQGEMYLLLKMHAQRGS